MCRARRGDFAHAAEVIGGVLELSLGGERRLHAVTVASTLARLTGRLEEARGYAREVFALPEFAAMTPPVRGQAPELARTAAAVGETAGAERLLDVVFAEYPYQQTLCVAARAVLAEADGDVQTAASLASSVVEPLGEFGAIPEQAHALFLLGRAKTALGDPEGRGTVLRARAAFAQLGMRPALADADAVLEGSVAMDA